MADCDIDKNQIAKNKYFQKSKKKLSNISFKNISQNALKLR